MYIEKRWDHGLVIKSWTLNFFVNEKTDDYVSKLIVTVSGVFDEGIVAKKTRHKDSRFKINIEQK